MTKEEVQMKAFQIIASAGDAFGAYYSAVKEYKAKNINEAKRLVEEGDKKINDAHQIHTDLIHAEVRGEEIPGSIVLTHSQDHLLQAMTWENIAKLLIDEE